MFLKENFGTIHAKPIAEMEEAFLMWMLFGGEYMALHLLLELLEDKQHFSGGDYNIPRFPHHIKNIRVFDFLNELSK